MEVKHANCMYKLLSEDISPETTAHDNRDS